MCRHIISYYYSTSCDSFLKESVCSSFRDLSFLIYTKNYWCLHINRITILHRLIYVNWLAGEKVLLIRGWDFKSDQHQLIMPPISKECSNTFLERSFIYAAPCELNKLSECIWTSSFDSFRKSVKTMLFTQQYGCWVKIVDILLLFRL